jgi:geranylgeranyl diphosphate synthase type II
MLEKYKKDIETFIDGVLSQMDEKNGVNQTLQNAIRYVLGSGGKRLRPSIMMYLCDVFEVPFELGVVPAAALELIHNYTLVHDDLPGMDDDEFRRGLPTCHKKFSEGIAILTGNALFTLALQIMMNGMKNNGELLYKAMQVLLSASSVQGVLSGQAFDIEMMKDNKNTIIGLAPESDLMEVLNMYYLKTGKLFEAAFLIPGILAKMTSEQQNLLSECGSTFGVLYQIHDDMNDIESDRSTAHDIKKSLSENFDACVNEMPGKFDKKKILVLKDWILNNS